MLPNVYLMKMHCLLPTIIQLENQKAVAFAQQMNDQEHQRATDWVPKIKKQLYKPSGIVRGADIKWPRNIVRGQ